MLKMSKIVKCVDCQKESTRKLLNRMGRCHDCALKKMMSVPRQLHAHSGPEYEHWKAAMKSRIGRL